MSNFFPHAMKVEPGAVLVVDTIENCQQDLWPAERLLTADVTMARLRELRAGRSAARHAIRLLEVEPGPILSAATGEPIWIPNICGSISHSARHIAVIVAHSSNYGALGVDIADGRRLGRAAVRTVATPEELALLEPIGSSVGIESISAEGIAFSAKEAVFKCQFPLTQNANLDFLDLRLRTNDNGNLQVEPTEIRYDGLGQVLSSMRLDLYNIQGLIVICARFPHEE